MHKNVEEYEMIPDEPYWHEYRHGDLLLTVLNIYAPNNHTESENFFKELKLKFEKQNLFPSRLNDGYFNIVEDAIDRLPAHTDHEGATQVLYDLEPAWT